MTFGGTASPSDGHTLSPADSTATPTDPPREVKLNKMAQLKKVVTERRQQKQSLGSGEKELVEEAVASDQSGASLTGYDSLNTNNNNSSGTTSTTSSEGEMGRRAMSGDLPRPQATPLDDAAKIGSMSDIFVSKSSLRPLKKGAKPLFWPSVNQSKPATRRQRKSEAEEQVTSEPNYDDVI